MSNILNELEDEYNSIIDTIKNKDFTDKDTKEIKRSNKGIIKDNSMSWNEFSPKNQKPKHFEKVLNNRPVSANVPNGESLLNKFTNKENFLEPNKSSLTKEDFEYAKKRYEEDNKKEEKPIERTKEEKAIIISSNGMTLTEWLDSKGRKSRYSKPTKDIRKAVKHEYDLKNPTYLDTNYVRKMKKEKELLEGKREKLNTVPKATPNTFLDLYAKETNYEKQILKSLGINKKELHSIISPNSILTETEKARILSVGYFGNKSINEFGYQDKFSFTTLGDLHYLYYLDKFKFATTRILQVVSGKNLKAVQGNLSKLYKLGLIQKIQILSQTCLWGLSESGAILIGSEREVPKKEIMSTEGVEERLYVNHIAACLWSNTVNALNLSDFPSMNRDFQGEKVRGENLVSESEMLSARQKIIMYLKGGTFYKKDRYKGETTKMLKELWEIEWRKWEKDGGKSPELNDPFFYLIYNSTDYTHTVTIPDLVVVRDRSKDGKPNSIAIEVERSLKSVDGYIKKLLSYKYDERIYGKVVYITPNNLIAKRLVEAKEKIDFDRLDIMPLMNLQGVSKSRTPWSI